MFEKVQDCVLFPSLVRLQVNIFSIEVLEVFLYTWEGRERDHEYKKAVQRCIKPLLCGSQGMRVCVYLSFLSNEPLGAFSCMAFTRG